MVFILKRKKMNKLFKILIFILAVEIILGYSIYFKNSSLVSGYYVSSTIKFIDKALQLINPITKNSNKKSNNSGEEKKTNETIDIDCDSLRSENQILSVSGLQSYRKPIKFQTNIDFLNTFNPAENFLILIVGNSETFGWYQKDDDRLHNILQKKLRKHINTKKIYVLNISYPGSMISDHLTDIFNFSDIYNPDLVIFYTGGNEIQLKERYKEILKNYSLNLKNYKIFSFEKKNEYNNSTLIFPNKLQKCLNDNLFLNENNFKENHSLMDVKKHIEKNFQKINETLNKRSIDFIFYIQPFNKELSISEKSKVNFDKISSLLIKNKNFKNLNLLNKDLNIDFVDIFHSTNTGNVSDYLISDILINFENSILKKVKYEKN